MSSIQKVPTTNASTEKGLCKKNVKPKPSIPAIKKQEVAVSSRSDCNVDENTSENSKIGLCPGHDDDAPLIVNVSIEKGCGQKSAIRNDSGSPVQLQLELAANTVIKIDTTKKVEVVAADFKKASSEPELLQIEPGAVITKKSTDKSKRKRDHETLDHNQCETIERPAKKPKIMPTSSATDDKIMTDKERESLELQFYHRGMCYLRRNPDFTDLVGERIMTNIAWAMSKRKFDTNQFSCMMETILDRGKAMDEFKKIQDELPKCMQECRELETLKDREKLVFGWFEKSDGVYFC